MSTGRVDFDPSVDSFSTTYNALATPRSLGGGIKCITINGRSALQYVPFRHMNWGDRYRWLFGRGDFDPSKMVDVVNDGAMIAGLRRHHFATMASAPEAVIHVQGVIERSVKKIFYRAARPAAESAVTIRIVGDRVSPRSMAQDPVALQNFFSTYASIEDMRRIGDKAEAEQSLARAEVFIKELFIYVLPDEQVPREVTAQLERGISILLKKRAGVGEIFELFSSACLPDASVDLVLKRFLALFLGSLSLVELPIQSLKEGLNFLKGKIGSRLEIQKLIEEIGAFVETIEAHTNKNQEDICFVVIPFLFQLFLDFPNVNFEERKQFIVRCRHQYDSLRRSDAPHVKDSLPGLAAFSDVIRMDVCIQEIYRLRPNSYRTGDERKDFSLFFHHVLEAARHSDPSIALAVLRKALPFLLEHLWNTAYVPFVQDLLSFVQIVHEGDGINVIFNMIIPFLESVVPKKVPKSEFLFPEAQRAVVDGIFSFVLSSQDPVTVLLHCLPILSKQMGIPENSPFIEDLRNLLGILGPSQKWCGLVRTLLIPLLADVIYNNKEVKLGENAARDSTIVSYVIYLITHGVELEGILSSDLKQTCDTIRTIVGKTLLQEKRRSVICVQQQRDGGSGASLELQCKTVGISVIGSLLMVQGNTLNLRLLPTIIDVFFGNDRGDDVDVDIPSAPPSEDQLVLEALLKKSISRATDVDYNEVLRNAGVPAMIRQARSFH